MPAKSRRAYKGAAVNNSLKTAITDTGTSLTLNVAMSGWDTSGTPFFCVIDPGTTKEEKICVIYATSTTLTVVDPAVTSGWSASVNGRGSDNTTGRAHDAGAVIYPVFTAYEANQANELVSKYASTGAMVYQDATSFATLALGTTGYPLVAGASAPAWGQLSATGIATDAVTTDKILNLNVTEGKIAEGAVTSAKIASKTIVEADVATALLKLVCPVGTIQAYPGATAPTGWLLCTGVSTTGYTELIALVGSTTPDLRGKVLVGKGSAPFDGALLSSFGSTTSTAAHTHVAGSLATANATTGVTTQSSGAHSHKIDGVQQQVQNNADTNQFILNVYNSDNFDTTTDGAHSHTMTDPGHSHTISGSTGASDVSATHGNVQPSTLINYIIKHDYA
jgi:microcystin-dependent protein